MSEPLPCKVQGKMYYTDDEEDEEESFITFTTSESKCDSIFDEALEAAQELCYSEALDLTLDCLVSVQQCHYMKKLLPTLHHLAYVYHSLGERLKAEEVARVCALLQNVMATTVKWTGKGKRRSKIGFDCIDCRKAFLQKANELKEQTTNLMRAGAFHQAIEPAQNVFRVHQYVLGIQDHKSQESLGDLIIVYTNTGRQIYHVPNSTDRIVFTCDMLSPSSQFAPLQDTNELAPTRNTLGPIHALSLDSHNALSTDTYTLTSSEKAVVFDDSSSQNTEPDTKGGSADLITTVESNPIKEDNEGVCKISYCSMFVVLSATTIAALVVIFR